MNLFPNLESNYESNTVQYYIRGNFLTRLIHCITHNTFCQLIISHKFNNNLLLLQNFFFVSSLKKVFLLSLLQRGSGVAWKVFLARKLFARFFVGTPAVPFMEQSCVSSDSFIDREFIGCHTSNCIAKASSHCIVFSQKNSQLTFCWIFVQK